MQLFPDCIELITGRLTSLERNVIFSLTLIGAMMPDAAILHFVEPVNISVKS
jgi:hypothetical protein